MSFKNLLKRIIPVSRARAEQNYNNLLRENAELKQMISDLSDALKGNRRELHDTHLDTGKIREEVHSVHDDAIKIRTELHNFYGSFRTSQTTLHMQQNKLKDDVNKLKNDNNNTHKRLQYEVYKYMDTDKYVSALVDWYYKNTGKHLNLAHPRTYNEIIQWTKLYDMGPDKIRLVDKYLVRDWVKEKIGEKYLIPLIAKWNSTDEIDFGILPEKFVLKCNHGCGYNIIVTDKSSIDQKEICKKLDNWMHEDYSFKNGFELQYSKIERCILAEEYLENNNEDLYDYKVFCFNGKAKYIMFISNRKNGVKKQIYDLDWNLQPFMSNGEINDQYIEKPNNLSELINCAEKLAEGFLQVRVDFYRLNDSSWKFGEMTFTPASGMARWEPEEYDEILGSQIDLSDITDFQH